MQLSLVEFELKCNNPNCRKRYFVTVNKAMPGIDVHSLPLCTHCGGMISGKNNKGETIKQPDGAPVLFPVMPEVIGYSYMPNIKETSKRREKRKKKNPTIVASKKVPWDKLAHEGELDTDLDVPLLM